MAGAGAGYFDFAAVFLDNLLGDVEAKAGAFLYLLMFQSALYAFR